MHRNAYNPRIARCQARFKTKMHSERFGQKVASRTAMTIHDGTGGVLIKITFDRQQRNGHHRVISKHRHNADVRGIHKITKIIGTCPIMRLHH